MGRFLKRPEEDVRPLDAVVIAGCELTDAGGRKGTRVF